jgi:U3 small nucleolar ribonucleoprotein protein IMP4
MFFRPVWKIALGTLDQKDVQVEWVARPYMNTAKKRKFL